MVVTVGFCEGRRAGSYNRRGRGVRWQVLGLHRQRMHQPLREDASYTPARLRRLRYSGRSDRMMICYDKRFRGRAARWRWTAPSNSRPSMAFVGPAGARARPEADMKGSTDLRLRVQRQRRAASRGMLVVTDHLTDPTDRSIEGGEALAGGIGRSPRKGWCTLRWQAEDLPTAHRDRAVVAPRAVLLAEADVTTMSPAACAMRRIRGEFHRE